MEGKISDQIQYLKELAAAVVAFPFWKTFLVGLITTITYLFGNNRIFMESLSILIVIDLITGIMAARKRKERIISSKVIRTGYKILLYLLILCAGHQMTRISGLFLWFDQFTVLLLSSTEFLSILENLSCCGLAIPDWVIKKVKRVTAKR